MTTPITTFTHATPNKLPSDSLTDAPDASSNSGSAPVHTSPINLELFASVGTPNFKKIQYSEVRPAQSGRTLDPVPRRLAALHKALNNSGDSNPDDLLEHMMMNHFIKPTFNVERETQRYLHFPDILKGSGLAAPWTEFNIASILPLTDEVLVSLQQRLEDPQQTSSADSAFSVARDSSQRTIPFLDVAVAILRDSEEPFTTFYRLKLMGTIRGNSSPIRRLTKFRSSRNTVELVAVWEKRTFRFREFIREIVTELGRRSMQAD